MKAKSLVLFATAALLASCGGAPSESSSASSPSQASSEPSVPSSASSGEEYDVSWVSPTGIPTLAFYDQGENENWLSYADATQVAAGFATDNVDAIVFDGYAGLNNIRKNNRNYVLARWISGGTFYLVSTKHSELSEYVAGQTIEAFVKTGNASQAFLNLAKNAWNWGDLSGEDAPVTWETGVAAVKNTLEKNDEAYDWYVVAQPVLFAVANALKQAGKTLNVVADLQEEWANAYDGAKIPAAALFVNKTRYAAHKNAIDAFIEETEDRIDYAVNTPSVAVEALAQYASAHDDIASRFGFQPAVVNALQKDGANKFGLVEYEEGMDLSAIPNSFAEALGGQAFDSSLFLAE